MCGVIKTSAAPHPRARYSLAIVAADLVFVAEQSAVNPKTNELELGDIRSETRRTHQNIRSILEEAGSSLREVVRVGVFLANIEDFEATNEVYREFFPEDPPVPRWEPNYLRLRSRLIALRGPGDPGSGSAKSGPNCWPSPLSTGMRIRVVQ